MLLQASALTEDEQRALANYISNIPWGSINEEEQTETLTMCESHPDLASDALEKSHWSGWGLDLDNTHFHNPVSTLALGAQDLENLEFKWALGYARRDQCHDAAGSRRWTNLYWWARAVASTHSMLRRVARIGNSKQPTPCVALSS